MIRPLLKAGIVAASIFLGLAAQAEAATTSLTIGLSNGWVGSEWRTQMIAEAQAAAAAWKARGVDIHVVVQSATTDVPGQIGQGAVIMAVNLCGYAAAKRASAVGRFRHGDDSDAIKCRQNLHY